MALQPVTDRTHITISDFWTFETVGGDFVTVDCDPALPFLTNGGLDVTLFRARPAGGNGIECRRQTNDGSTSWESNFAGTPPIPVIFNRTTIVAVDDSIVITFDIAQQGAAIQLVQNVNAKFDGRVRLRDAGGGLLAEYTAPDACACLLGGGDCDGGAPGTCLFAPILGGANDDGTANIKSIEINVFLPGSATESVFGVADLFLGPFASGSSTAPSSPSRCFATSPGTGVPFSLSRGTARHGRVIAIAGRDELLISDGVETLGVHLRGVAWRAIGRGCTGLFYEADTDATVASFGTATYELEREGALTDNGSGLTLTVETPAVASDAAVPMRLQRLYVEADTRGQSVVPTLVLDETTIVLAAFVTAARTTVEYALDVSARVAGVRLNGAALADRVDVFGVDLDYYVPEGEPGATFTIPDAPMMADA